MSSKPEVHIGTMDSILSGDKPDLNRAVMCILIGEKDHMHKKALATAVLTWRALKIEPTTAITLGFGGYDDDARELWEIPEVCAYVRKFCAKTKAHEHKQLDPQSRNWLLACGADPTRNVSVTMISKQKALDETLAFYRQTVKPPAKI
jgi:hypothetical protein